MVLARAPAEHDAFAAAARSHLCAGPRARAVRRRAPQRVLREPVRRSHAAAASDARLRGRIAAESGGGGPQSVVRRSARCATATSFATDALQFHGSRLATGQCGALAAELPSRRLQHEHSMVVDSGRDDLHVDAGQSIGAGFFGGIVADHPEAHFAAPISKRVDEAIGAARSGARHDRLRPRGRDDEPRRCSLRAARCRRRELDDGALRTILPRRVAARRARRARHAACRSFTATTVTSCCAPRSCACSGRTVICCAPAVHLTPDETRADVDRRGWTACFIRWSRRVT